MEKLSGMICIKRFFEADGGRKITMEELRAVSKEDRAELAALCAEALGVELSPTA